MPCCLNRVITALLHVTPLFLSLWQLLFHGSLYTRDVCASLRDVHLSVCRCLASPVFLTPSVSMHFCLSVADYHFLFFSVTEESHLVCISLSQPPSLSSFLHIPPYFHHFPCHTCFPAFPPRCSIVALAVPLLIHHLLLSTDLLAKNKLLQLRDRKKMPSSLESVMAEETETTK